MCESFCEDGWLVLALAGRTGAACHDECEQTTGVPLMRADDEVDDCADALEAWRASVRSRGGVVHAAVGDNADHSIASSVQLCSLLQKGSCFFSSRRRHTRLQGAWSSDVCSSD